MIGYSAVNMSYMQEVYSARGEVDIIFAKCLFFQEYKGRTHNRLLNTAISKLGLHRFTPCALDASHQPLQSTSLLFTSS